MDTYPDIDRPLTNRQLGFIERVAAGVEPFWMAARAAGYSTTSAFAAPSRLFKDERVVRALAERGFTISRDDPE
jgi:hypothetical protein